MVEEHLIQTYHRIPPNVRRFVGEILYNRVGQRINNTSVGYAGYQAQRPSSKVFVWVLQLYPQRVAGQEHLIFESVISVGLVLLDYLPVEEHKLPEGVRVVDNGDDGGDDVHDHPRE